jgi:hypothetical protein
MEYTLQIGKKKLKGKTDQSGILRKMIPAGTDKAKLILHCVTLDGDKTDFWTIDLDIGPLDGFYAVLGIKARLNNLGLFASKEVDLARPEAFDNLVAVNKRDYDDQYHRAMDRFKALFGTGGLTPEERAAQDMQWDKVKEVYGS